MIDVVLKAACIPNTMYVIMLRAASRVGSASVIRRLCSLFIIVIVVGFSGPVHADECVRRYVVVSPDEFGRAIWRPAVGRELHVLLKIALFLDSGTREPLWKQVGSCPNFVSDRPRTGYDPRRDATGRPIWEMADVELEAFIRIGGLYKGEAILEYGLRLGMKSAGLMHDLLADRTVPPLAPLAVLVWLDDDASFEAIKSMAQSRIARRRQIGLNALAWMESDRAIEALIATSRSADAAISRSAIKTMGLVGASRLAQRLVELTDSDDANVRECAILSLRAQRGDEVMARLRELAKVPDRTIGLAVLDTLARQQTVEAMDLLVSMTTSADRALVEHAVEALGSYGHSRAVTRLQEFANSEDQEIRNAGKRAYLRATSGKPSIPSPISVCSLGY